MRTIAHPVISKSIMNSPISSAKITKRLYCFMLLCILNLCYVSRLNAASEKIEVKRNLGLSNKIPLKSIESPDGDTIDCINIYQQPAFDHPLLKNLTILMKPSYHPEKGLRGESKLSDLKAREEDTNPITQLWQLKGTCPEGTIPIRRTPKENVLRANSIKRYGNKTYKNITDQLSSAGGKLVINAGHEYAVATVQIGTYYGARATINIWKPHVQEQNEFSLSQIWVLGGTGLNLNSVEAGYGVFPSLYGDRSTRFFTFWTNDGYQSTGCYNLLCSGFVQTHKEIALGAAINPISTYHGSQFQITIHIWKDQKQDVWWLQCDNTIFGYWPASLFTNLADSASVIEWGGEVVNLQANGQHTTTQMGSGHFPEEKFGGASFFKNLQVVDESNSLRSPSVLGVIVREPKCYDMELGGNNDWGDFFYYGGPGRNPRCP